MGLMEIASFTDPCEEHFHIFMPSSLPLKVVKGGLWILQTTRRLMRSPLFKWINRTRQESCWQIYAGPQSGMTAGWANGTGGGWGLTGRPSRRWSPLSLSPLFFLCLYFLWFLSTKIDSGTFAHWWIFLFPLCSKARCETLPYSYGLALIMWQTVITAHSCLGAGL